MTGMLKRRALTGDPLGVPELLDWLGTDPGLRANMVASVDGRTVVGGRVGSLTGPADQLLLVALRAWCDVLLVGVGTIRAEGYGPIELPQHVVERRVERGQAPHPVVAVLAGRGDVDPGLPVFAHAQADARPWLITATGSHQARLESVAHVRQVAAVLSIPRSSVFSAVNLEGSIHSTDALTIRGQGATIDAAGLDRVLSEGGPTVLGPMLGQGLVHELFLTVSPVVVGGQALGLVQAPEYPAPIALTLADVLGAENEVFLRYAVSGAEGRQH